MTGATNSWNVKIADVGNPGRMTTGLRCVTARQIGLPGLSATPWATMPGSRSACTTRYEMSPAPLDVPPENTTMSDSSPCASAAASASSSSRNDAQMHGFAAQFLDRRADDRGVGVVHGAGAQRLTGRDDLVAGREDRDARPTAHGDVAHSDRREHADLARREPLPGAQHGFAARDVGARVTDVFAWSERPPDFDEGTPSAATSSECSTISTASAPRGSMPPVAMGVADPAVTSMAGTMPGASTSSFVRNVRGVSSMAP